MRPYPFHQRPLTWAGCLVVHEAGNNLPSTRVKAYQMSFCPLNHAHACAEDRSGPEKTTIRETDEDDPIGFCLRCDFRLSGIHHVPHRFRGQRVCQQQFSSPKFCSGHALLFVSLSELLEVRWTCPLFTILFICPTILTRWSDETNPSTLT